MHGNTNTLASRSASWSCPARTPSGTLPRAPSSASFRGWGAGARGGSSTGFLTSWVRWLLGRPAAAKVDLSVPFLQEEQYVPPSWAAGLSLVPRERVGLAMLPTPIHPWRLPGLPANVQVWIKRDDLTGMQLSGNKVRKLEFLLADAKRQGADCVVTIGGIQSNHCRATAVAARYLGMEAHLLLRTSRHAVASDPGLDGNLLVDRMVGAHIHLVTKEEYGQHGSKALGEALVAQLEAQGKRPYLIPVGGSNALGTWGYLQAVEEIRQQCGSQGFTDLVMACGSGGTTAGLALGVHLAGLKLHVHAYGVCDDENYFYNYIDDLVDDLGAGTQAGGLGSRALLRAVQARGLGYAISSEAELQTVKAVAEATGIVLDPVYSGKAVHALLQEIRSQPEAWANRKVLFVHTGGLLGMYDREKLQQLQSLPAEPASSSPSGARQPAGRAAGAMGPLGASPSSSSSAAVLVTPASSTTTLSGATHQAPSAGHEAASAPAQYGGRVHRFVVPSKRK